jgi:DNA-binding Lrp family transcriptional regulator
MSRKRVNVSEDQIAKYAQAGASMRMVAKFVGCSEKVIRGRLRRAYDRGQVSRQMMLLQQQYKMAMAGSVPMLIHLGKTELGQKETVVNEQTGKDGGAIKIQAVPPYDYKKLSDAELRQIKSLMTKAQS